jgi:hypothetical protein
MRRMLLALVVTAAALGPAVPASAAVTDCGFGRICVWPKTDFDGSMVSFLPHRFVGELCVALPFRSIKLHADRWFATAYRGTRCNEDDGGFADYTPGAYEADIFHDLSARSISFSHIRRGQLNAAGRPARNSHPS